MAPSRHAIRMAWAGLLCSLLAGCAGWAGLADGICNTPSLQCIASTPVGPGRPPAVEPSAPVQGGTADRELDRRMKAVIAADRKDRVEKANGMALTEAPAGAHFPPGHVQRYRQLTRLAATMDGGRILPVRRDSAPGASRHYGQRWRHARQTLFLGGKAGKAKEFRFSTLQAIRSQIDFRNILDRPLSVWLECAGPATLFLDGAERQLQPGTPARFTLAARSAGEAWLQPALQTRRCDLAHSGETTVRIALLRDDGRDGIFAGLDGRYDVCAAPAGPMTALERAFHADRWLSQSCVLRTGALKLLPDPDDGFNAKVEALLGKPLSEAFIAAGDPMAPLDFSRAPRLSLVYASYLDIKADFSGMIFTRLLRHHGERGVPIRILVTGILQRDKDRALLEQLAADHPNIQLQEFAWQAPRGAAYDELVAQIHRANHIKLLAVLSPEAGRSRAILGGRNIHDGFLYRMPLDLTRYPQLHTYERAGQLTLNYYANYRDFDLAVHDEETVRAMAAHLSTIWHRDHETQVIQPFSVQREGKSGARKGMRHFISMPYADRGALERYYVELIDAAEDSIEIANPYLNPPPAIERALRDAAARGVRVTIVARIDLHGDLGGAILTELNQMFVEKHAGRFAIYSYREPGVVLHSKLLMIDGKLSMISSVNFNHRSFLHDSENGLAIYDPEEYQRIREIFEVYRAASIRLDGKADRKPLYRLLLRNDLLRKAL